MTPGVLSPLAVLAPLGISPFLALGLIGLAASTTGLVLPSAFGILEFAPVWIGLLVLAALLKLGRSFKLTKPLAETFGTSESLVALLALAAMFLSPGAVGATPAGTVARLFGAGAPAAAGFAGTTVLVLAAMTGLLAIIAVRMGFDLLTWLSPIPLLDALLQFIKLVVTAVFVAAAVFTPRLAVALNIAVLVAVVIAARWLARIAYLGLHVFWDGIAGRLRPAPIPRGEDDDRIGPLRVYVLGGSGLPWMGRVDVWWTGGDWLAGRRFEEVKRWKFLGEAVRCTLHQGILGTTLTTPAGRFFLTPRYHAGLAAMAHDSGTRLTRRAWAESPALELHTIPPR